MISLLETSPVFGTIEPLCTELLVGIMKLGGLESCLNEPESGSPEPPWFLINLLGSSINDFVRLSSSLVPISNTCLSDGSFFPETLIA